MCQARRKNRCLATQRQGERRHTGMRSAQWESTGWLHAGVPALAVVVCQLGSPPGELGTPYVDYEPEASSR